MMDRYGRTINNMRIAVTQKCNLDCFYCHHEGENGKDEKKNNGQMSPFEIERIAKIAGMVGIEKLKITGGEPLLRRDIVDIVTRTSRYMNEVSMTTNGVLLGKYARQLKEAGLKRVNISFDALDSKTFQLITDRTSFLEVKTGVHSAIEAGLYPVKLNMVVLKGINEKDILRAIEFAGGLGAVLQLIEFEGSKRQTSDPLFKSHHLDLRDWEKWLSNKALEIKQRRMQRRKKYILPSENNGNKEIEVVRSMHNSEFCENCTRLRVTSQGELKPCLLRDDNHIDILGPMRNGASDEELVSLFRDAILEKEPYWRV